MYVCVCVGVWLGKGVGLSVCRCDVEYVCGCVGMWACGHVDGLECARLRVCALWCCMTYEVVRVGWHLCMCVGLGVEVVYVGVCVRCCWIWVCRFAVV